MAQPQWINSTKFTGVRWYKHPTRRFKGTPRFDRCFGIRYTVNKKRYEAVLGWENEGWTEEGAYLKRQEFIDNLKQAAGPATPKQDYLAKRQAAEEEKRLDIQFKTYFDTHYLPEASRRKKPHTIRTEKQLVRDWILPEVKAKPMRSIEPEDMERVKSSILDTGRARRTAQHALAVFRLVWNHARKRKVLNTESPTHGVSVGKLNNQRIRFLTRNEAHQLLEAIQEIDQDAWELTLAALYTGARLGELTQLTWAHVDLETPQLTLIHTKTGKPRTLPIVGPLLEMLRCKEPGQPSEHIFTNRAGAPWREAPWAFRHCVEKLGLNEGREDRRERLVFHSLRHTAASLMLASGVDARTIQSIFGWSTLAMLERYTHVMDENKAKAAQALEYALNNKPGKIIKIGNYGNGE